MDQKTKFITGLNVILKDSTIDMLVDVKKAVTDELTLRLKKLDLTN